MEADKIAARFRSYPVATPERRDAHTLIRDSCEDLARIVNGHVPEGREKSLAITKLEEVMMWANAGIAREGAGG